MATCAKSRPLSQALRLQPVSVKFCDLPGIVVCHFQGQAGRCAIKCLVLLDD